jgi:hypothetical protein
MIMIFSPVLSQQILTVLEKADASVQGICRFYQKEVSDALKSSGYVVIETFDTKGRTCFQLFLRIGTPFQQTRRVLAAAQSSATC